jgi:hypothetical protein
MSDLLFDRLTHPLGRKTGCGLLVGWAVPICPSLIGKKIVCENLTERDLKLIFFIKLKWNYLLSN